MSIKFDEVMENSFGKTLPQDIKIEFIRQHIEHWSDLGCQNALKSIPDDIQIKKAWDIYRLIKCYEPSA